MVAMEEFIVQSMIFTFLVTGVDNEVMKVVECERTNEGLQNCAFKF